MYTYNQPVRKSKKLIPLFMAAVLALCLVFAFYKPPVKALNSAAACDGSTDDTTTINNELSSGVDKVILPKGTCKITDRIVMPDDVHLQGQCPKCTVIKKDFGVNARFPGIEFAGTDDGQVSDLGVDGSVTANPANGATRREANGIFVKSGSDNVKIWNTEVFNNEDNGIESDGTDTDIHDNYVHGNFSNGIYVIGLSNGTRAERVWIHHNRVEDNSVGTTAWDGIDIDPVSADCVVESNTVIGNDIIVFETTNDVSESYGHRILNNQILDSPQNGINILGGLREIEVRGNRIVEPTGFGIAFNGLVWRSKIEGNFIVGTTQAGIYVHNDAQFVSGAPNNIHITNNHVENPSTGNSNVYKGITVGNSATDIFITNNSVKDTRSPKQMKYAMSTSGAATNLQIFGNNTNPGLTGTFESAAGQTLTDNF